MRYLVTQVALAERLLEVEAESSNEAYDKAIGGEYQIRKTWRVKGPPQNVTAEKVRECVEE